LTGAGLAWLCFNDLWWLAVIVATLAIALGSILDAAGDALLPARPLAALALLEWWLLTPAMAAASAGALVIVVTVALTVPEGTSADTKELVGALSAAITSFLTAGFISWASDEKDSRLGDHIKERFQARYNQVPAEGTRKAGVYYFKPESVGLRWVYSDEYKGIEGWGREARRKRAKGIAAELSSGNSDAP
jgi:hypothetical protein